MPPVEPTMAAVPYRMKEEVTNNSRRSQGPLATTQPSESQEASPGYHDQTAACPDGTVRSRSERAAPGRDRMVGRVVDNLHLRVAPELWVLIFSHLPAIEIRNLRGQSFGICDLIDTNQNAIARGAIKRALSRLGQETEQANSLPSEFIEALREWLQKYGICENCYNSAQYDDLDAFIWHWSHRISPKLTTEQQPRREDFDTMNTACRYIIALESMALQLDLAKRVQFTRQYGSRLQTILRKRQDLYALKCDDEMHALLDRLEWDPQPYPYELRCGGHHFLRPPAHVQVSRNDFRHEDETLEETTLVALRSHAKIINFETDVDRDQALQRLHHALGIPRLMESAPATYHAPRNAKWVRRMVERIILGEALEFDSLDQACILEAIKIA
ncbi:hypothetical protein AC578_7662 [Pseudocercospora eumusae]|uniref:Uncharacterized protein n=1 Tax=Pseudocercospora eumusae TaxID=321146 RepID=A0A139GXJ8_9PEZI|nr:hypothetical protein AC578_7662 [Pseudocercospora eumusae]KXS94911.1 hypothetical protein AC578_7662 [Pseudocercospora eumusae]